jgi:hypothetical protein
MRSVGSGPWSSYVGPRCVSCEGVFNKPWPPARIEIYDYTLELGRNSIT